MLEHARFDYSISQSECNSREFPRCRYRIPTGCKIILWKLFYFKLWKNSWLLVFLLTSSFSSTRCTLPAGAKKWLKFSSLPKFPQKHFHQNFYLSLGKWRVKSTSWPDSKNSLARAVGHHPLCTLVTYFCLRCCFNWYISGHSHSKGG